MTQGVENISLLPQNGSAGCITACMANVDRIYFGSDLTAVSLDAHLERQPDEDYSTSSALLWFMDKGLRVTNVTYDPTDFDGFLKGRINKDDWFELLAVHEFGGSVEEARAAFDTDDFAEWHEQLRIADQKQVPLFDHYTQLGRWSEVEKIPDYDDLLRATRNGSLVLGVHGQSTDNVNHAVLAFKGPEDDQENVSVFYPSEEDFEMDEHGHNVRVKRSVLYANWPKSEVVEDRFPINLSLGIFVITKM